MFYCLVQVLRKFSSGRVNRNFTIFSMKTEIPPKYPSDILLTHMKLETKCITKSHIYRFRQVAGIIKDANFQRRYYHHCHPQLVHGQQGEWQSETDIKYHIISRTELLLNCCSIDFLDYKQFKTFYLLKAQTGKSEWHEVKIVILKKSCNLYLIQTPHAL